MTEETHPIFENLRFLNSLIESDCIPEFGKELAKQEVNDILAILN